MAVAMTLDERCRIDEPDTIFTPAIAVFPALIHEHIGRSIAMAGGTDRLRPHCKTHKTLELTRLELEAGIEKHKAATIAEAEMLLEAGVADVVLAYPLVGPNVGRFVTLMQRYPQALLRPLVDHPAPLAALGQAVTAAGRECEVLLDLEVGQGRTGILPGPAALDLYRSIAETPGLRPAGLHVYDGHNHQPDAAERDASVTAIWDQVRAFVADLEAAGLPVPRFVCGGTPTFPCWARLAAEEPRIELSPGTFFLNDWGYYHAFEDVPFPPAALVLTRVISKPRPGRLTLDAGTKAIAPDKAEATRLILPELPDAKIVGHNEEHLVIETAEADRFQPGDLLRGWPRHICPTCALHQELVVIEDGRVTGHWAVIARDRRLTC